MSKGTITLALDKYHLVIFTVQLTFGIVNTSLVLGL